VAITATQYGAFSTGLVSATAARRIDWVGDTIKVALTTSAYTPDQDAHDFFNDVTNEITGTGYTAGGATLSGKSISYDSATNETRMLAATSSWPSSSFTARRAVVYKDTGTASTSPLIGWVDFGADETIASGNFSLVWDGTRGVAVIAAA
jgi:hypothetical protein